MLIDLKARVMQKKEWENGLYWQFDVGD